MYVETKVKLENFCLDIQENISQYLSTRDIFSLSQVCWPQVLQLELDRRKNLDHGITSIVR